jgi:crossover junction endodeoxyribonuclease RuvC
MNNGAPSIVVLGLDPGSRKMGYGLIRVGLADGRIKHLAHGVIRPDPSAELPVRMVQLSLELQKVIEKHRPGLASVEEVFVSKSARSALVLGQARGAALATLGLAGIPVESHPATVVKQRITGKGRASKAQVQMMVCTLLGLKGNPPPPEDAADALAAALCQAIELSSPRDLRPSPKMPRAKKGRGALAELARAQGKLPDKAVRS